MLRLRSGRFSQQVTHRCRMGGFPLKPLRAYARDRIATESALQSPDCPILMMDSLEVFLDGDPIASLCCRQRFQNCFIPRSHFKAGYTARSVYHMQVHTPGVSFFCSPTDRVSTETGASYMPLYLALDP